MLLAEEDMAYKKILADKVEMYWLRPGVIYIKLYQDVYVDMEEIIEIVSFQVDQNVGVDHKRIIHAEKFASISKEARTFLEKTAPTVKAETFIIPSLSQKILFNLYAKFRRNRNPIKGFDDLKSALEWLNQFE